MKEATKTRDFSFAQNIKKSSFRDDYKQIVIKWEEKTGKPFGELIAELRKDYSPEEVINMLGVSRGFIYYHFSLYMNRTAYLEHTHEMPLGCLVKKMREDGLTMEEISKELGLAVTTLYNHLRRTG